MVRRRGLGTVHRLRALLGLLVLVGSVGAAAVPALQAREVSALADYNRAVAALYRAIGTGFRADRLDLR